MSIAIVQGASKGIGFSIAKLLALNTDLKVIATARNSQTFEESIASCNFPRDRIEFITMDCTDEASIKKSYDHIEAAHGKESIKYFINAAAFLFPEKSLNSINHENVMEHFNVNIIGPMMVAKHFSKLMASPKKIKDRVVWANMSARTGSIQDNLLGGWYSYRISKSALNQLTKTMSIELGRKGIQVMALHPGTVDTDLSRRFVKNVGHQIYTPDQAAENMFNIFTKISENGVFLDHEGKTIPW